MDRETDESCVQWISPVMVDMTGIYLVIWRIRQSGANLALACDEPFGGRQFGQATWPACVEFVGADTDFGTEAKLAAVVEAGRGVEHHGRAVNFVHKLLGGLNIPRDNHFGVP